MEEQVYSPYMPELAELPKIEEGTLDRLRLQNTLAKRLPSLPAGSFGEQDLSFTNYKAEEAAQYANDLRASYAISRGQTQRSKAIAKAKNYQAQKAAERGAKTAYQTQRSMVGRTKRASDSYHLNFARQMGMGTDLYR